MPNTNNDVAVAANQNQSESKFTIDYAPYDPNHHKGYLAPLQKRKKKGGNYSCELKEWESCRESFLFRWKERVTHPQKEYSEHYFAFAIDTSNSQNINYNFNKLIKFFGIVEDVLGISKSERIIFRRDKKPSVVIVQPRSWWKACNARMSLLTILLRAGISDENTMEKMDKIAPNGKINNIQEFVSYLCDTHSYLGYTKEAVELFFSGRNYIPDETFSNIAHWVNFFRLKKYADDFKLKFPGREESENEVILKKINSLQAPPSL